VQAAQYHSFWNLLNPQATDVRRPKLAIRDLPVRTLGSRSYGISKARATIGFASQHANAASKKVCEALPLPSLTTLQALLSHPRSSGLQ
jgi:hypothetical protein